MSITFKLDESEDIESNKLYNHENDDENAEDAIDAFIGSQIKKRRTELEISQEDLADKTFLAFQQIQKIEKGSTKITPQNFEVLAQTLDTPINYFFDTYSSFQKKHESPSSNQSDTLNGQVTFSDSFDEYLLESSIFSCPFLKENFFPKNNFFLQNEKIDFSTPDTLTENDSSQKLIHLFQKITNAQNKKLLIDKIQKIVDFQEESFPLKTPSKF